MVNIILIYIIEKIFPKFQILQIKKFQFSKNIYFKMEKKIVTSIGCLSTWKPGNLELSRKLAAQHRKMSRNFMKKVKIRYKLGSFGYMGCMLQELFKTQFQLYFQKRFLSHFVSHLFHS